MRFKVQPASELEEPRLWFWIPWWFTTRLLAYPVPGAFASALAGGGVIGTLFGAMAGSSIGHYCDSGFGIGVGGCIGASGGAGLGLLIFLVAGLLSRTKDFWATFHRVWTFSVLGMNLAAVSAALSLVVFAVAWEARYGSGAPVPIPFLGPQTSDGLLSTVPILLMFFGQIGGAIFGMKKRWLERDEWLQNNLALGYGIGGLMGSCLPLLLFLIASPTRSQWDGGFASCLRMSLIGAMGGTTGGILAVFLLGKVAMTRLPAGDWPRFSRRLGWGLAAGLVVGLAGFLVYHRAPPVFYDWDGNPQDSIELDGPALSYWLVSWFPACLMVTATLWATPVLVRQWRERRSLNPGADARTP